MPGGFGQQHDDTTPPPARALLLLLILPRLLLFLLLFVAYSLLFAAAAASLDAAVAIVTPPSEVPGAQAMCPVEAAVDEPLLLVLPHPRRQRPPRPRRADLRQPRRPGRARGVAIQLLLVVVRPLEGVAVEGDRVLRSGSSAGGEDGAGRLSVVGPVVVVGGVPQQTGD